MLKLESIIFLDYIRRNIKIEQLIERKEGINISVDLDSDIPVVN